MYKITKLSLAVILLIFVFFPHSETQGQVSLKAVGVEGGWYVPSMDFWNENTFIKNWGDQLIGAIYGKGFIEIHLVKMVSVRIGAGYWTETRSKSGIIWSTETRTDELQLTLIPVTIDVVAGLDIAEIAPVYLYGGIGWGVNFVQMKYTRTPSVSAAVTDEESGRDYLGYLLAGINIPVTSNFAFALEGRYVLGQYIQEFYGIGDDVTNYDVSLHGPIGVLQLKYIF